MFLLAAVGGTAIGLAVAGSCTGSGAARRPRGGERARAGRAVRACTSSPSWRAHLGRARGGRGRALPRLPRPGERLRDPAAGAGGVAGERHDPRVGRVRADRAAADDRAAQRRRRRPARSSPELVVTAATVLARIVWVFPATYMPRVLFRRIRRTRPVPVVAGAGGDLLVGDARGGHAGRRVRDPGRRVPGRETIVFLAFFVTVATLLLHGLTLPVVIRRLGVRETGGPGRRAGRGADPVRRRAGLDRPARRARSRTSTTPPPSTPRRSCGGWPRCSANAVWEQLGRPDEEAGESPSADLPAAAPGDARARNAPRSSRAATPATSTTRSCAASCAASTWRRRSWPATRRA